jgi:hypothetical protein
MADNQVDLKLNLDFQGVNDALYQMIGQFNGTDKEFQKIANNIQKNAKNLEAAIKLFGPASQQAGAAAKKLEKDFQSLVANGIDPASASFKKMTASMPTASGLDAATGSLRKGNQQWANLALVIQDLPFGFRGIQNNLPAIASGFAKVSGPMLFGISAIIAAITAWDMGLFKLNKTVDSSAEYSKQAGENYAKEIVKLEGLIKVSKNANISLDDRAKAAKTLKEEYPGLLDKYSEEEIMLGKADTAFKKLTKTLWAYAKAKAAQSTLEDLAAKQNKLLVERADLLDEFSKKNLKSFSREATYTEDGIRLMSDYDRELSRRTGLLKENAKAYNDLEKQAGKYVKIQEANINAETDLKEFQTKTAEQLERERLAKEALAKADRDRAEAAKRRISDLGKINKAESDAVLSLMDEKDKELRIATKSYIDKLNLAAKYGEDTTILEIAWRNELAAIRKKYDDVEVQELNKKNEKIAKIYEDNRNGIRDAIRNINNGFVKDNVQSINDQTKAELKANKGRRRSQIQALEDEAKRLQEERTRALETGSDVGPVDKAIQKNIDDLKAYANEWQVTSDAINNAVEQMIEGGIAKFAENLGKALAGEKVDLFGGFLSLLAEGLSTIGKALIAYGVAMDAFKKAFSNPYAAIAAGVALIAIGSFIGAKISQTANGGSKQGSPKKFANGGIISGPTMGLMGEYPGASHNPEVVAPLDKLKSLIGGSGGGTLEARISGNDLLILMNKAGRNNNNTF